MAEDASPPLLTLAEMCSRYMVSNRRARNIVREHRVPVLQPGRCWLFDVRAETAFREATRLYSSDPTAPARRPTGSQARSAASEYAKALALIESGLPAKPSPSVKR